MTQENAKDNLKSISTQITPTLAPLIETIWRIRPDLKGDGKATARAGIAALARESEALEQFYQTFRSEPATLNPAPITKQLTIDPESPLAEAEAVDPIKELPDAADEF